MPVSPAGTVPQAWPTVLRLALTARPGTATAALFTLLRGKRVRAWNTLCRAAADNPGWYAAWIRVVEPRLLPSAAPVAETQVGAVLLGGDDAATRASLIAAFGPNVPIITSATLSFAQRPMWILPIRAGDRVSPALGATLARHLPDLESQLVYWDEDCRAGHHRRAPWIKPDWDPLLFATHDGLVGASVVRADAVPADGVADWHALARRAAERDPPRHIPLILTHRARPHAAATIAPQVAAPPVSISVIIPTRDHADVLETCLNGLADTRFPGEHEIIVVDNDSREPRTLALFAHLAATGRASILAQPGPFNFAQLTNAGVDAARGDFVCLLNNDIEIVAPDWLERMAALAVDDAIGAVGARLLYPDGALQHAGVAMGVGGAAGHVEKGVVPVPGEFAPWHDATRTVSAVTAACLLVQRSKFLAVGGMDSAQFAVDFNDVDLCLRLAARGWHSVYCAQATLIHHESRSRGKPHGPALARFERELATLRSRWATATVRDRYYSPLFRRQSERCLLAF